MKCFEIHQREEVDRLEVSIDGRWATDLCAHRPVRTQQFRYLVASALWVISVPLRRRAAVWFVAGGPPSAPAWSHRRLYHAPGFARLAKNNRSDVDRRA